MHEASKWYGDVIGLNQVSLQINHGITGLLGPNGAGKSTFLKLLTGQLQPSRGQVQVFGLDPWTDRDVYRMMGYCPDSEQLYEEMTGVEFVRLMGRLAGYSAAESARRAATQLERVSMAPHAGRVIHGYSKGMRQRVRLAAALIHEPRLVVLDEPLNGLDPMGRIEMLQTFRQIVSEGCSVVVSSHILHEIENLTRHMIMLHRGRVLAEGEISEVRGLIDRQPLTLRITTPAPRSVAAAVIGLEHVSSVEFPAAAAPAGSAGRIYDSEAPAEKATSIVVRTKQPDAVLQLLQQQGADKRLQISGIEALDDNLDAIFRYLVEE
jgi:ABC-2 type transport system ATP-binding protein